MRWRSPLRRRASFVRALAAGCAGALLLALTAPAAADPTVSSGPPHAREDAMPGGIPYDVRVAEIRRRIQEALVYPPLARRRQVEGESTVAFEVAASGSAADVEVVRSSGSALLDRAAERAVRDAAPLPPVMGRLRVPVRFALDEREEEGRAGARP